MREIALHLVDLAENSISAHASMVHISVCEDFRTNKLTTAVEDDGDGMTEEVARQVSDPFFTSRTTRKVGLGIPLLKASAEACGGELRITSRKGSGTRIEATFQHSHIDRMPLGDLPSTFAALSLAHPEIHWVFTYSFNPPYKDKPRVFEYDDTLLKQTVEGLPLTHPAIISYVRNTLETGIAGTRK